MLPQTKNFTVLCLSLQKTGREDCSHMNQSRIMCKILFSITKPKHSLNVMKGSEQNEKLENLCYENIFQNQFHTKIGTLHAVITSNLTEILELCIGI